MSSSEWTQRRLGDIAVLNYGKSLTSQKRMEGDVPVFHHRGRLTAYSGACRSVIPAHADHDSGVCRSQFPGHADQMRDNAG